METTRRPRPFHGLLAAIGALFIGAAKDARPATGKKDRDTGTITWDLPRGRGRRGHAWPGKGHGTPRRRRPRHTSRNPRGRAARAGR